jgi:hypothetical protein
MPITTQEALGKVTEKNSELSKIRQLEKDKAAVAEAKANGITKVILEHNGGKVELDPGASSDAVADSADSIIGGEITALKAAFNADADEDLTIS